LPQMTHNKFTARIVLLIAILFADLVCAQLPYAVESYYNPNNQLLSNIRTATEHQARKQEGIELRHALMTSLKEHPTMHQNGRAVTELHPPVHVTIGRTTKVRRIPHHEGEIIKRLPTGTPVVAIGATPDLLWLQIAEHEFLPTRDCNFAAPDDRRSVPVIPIEPALNVYVASKERVIVRKYPNEKGKAVGYLAHHDRIKIVGVTQDYTYAQIGHKQFVPIVALKAGNPLIELNPPVTIHIERSTPVYDMPTSIKDSIEGNVVSTLNKDDVVTAIATTEDYEWLKLGSGAYVKTDSTRMGLPHPAYTIFPKSLLVKLGQNCGVVKHPSQPEMVLRTLNKGDQLEVFGVTNDFKWLVVAHHRYIPILAARLVSPLPKEIPLNPHVPIKLSKDEIIRHIPDEKGRVMTKGKKGEELEAIAVTDDFTWLKLADRQWVPMTSVAMRHIISPLRTLKTPIQVTIKEDVPVRRRPDTAAKKRRTIAAGTVVTAIAATPDAEWLQLSEKEFIPSESGLLLPVPSIAPLTPPISVVILRDAKAYQSPNTNSIVVKRFPRGEVVQVVGTTTDLKWLKLADNRFLETQYASHVPSLITLEPPVNFVVATPVKARNVAAFAGMSIYELKKGERVVGSETTPDYKWVKIGEGRYLPTSALLLDEKEGDNFNLIMKQRTGEAARLAERGGKLTTKSLAPRRQNIEVTSTTPLAVRKLYAAQERMRHQKHSRFVQSGSVPTELPATGLFQRTDNRVGTPLKQVKVVIDAPVMNAARDDATQVKTIRKGTLVTVFAVDRNMNWLQVGPAEFIKLEKTDIVNQVKNHKM